MIPCNIVNISYGPCTLERGHAGTCVYINPGPLEEVAAMIEHAAARQAAAK